MLFIAGGYLLLRAFTLHFTDRIALSNPHLRESVRRGYIKDSGGAILAVSIEQGSLYANPEHIQDPQGTARVLAPILQMDKERILSRLSLDRQFIWIKRKLPDMTVSRIKSLKLPGIYFKKEFQRVYPHDTLASHIIGFTDIDNNGIAGIEYKYDSYLKGEEGVENVDSDNLVYGYNVTLTIDRFIQHTAEKYLFEAAETYSADKGAAVMMDVTNGRILACAVYPPYNPNFYYRYTPQERSLYSIVEPFEPGSTMKIFAASAWLNSDAKDFNRTYHGNGKTTLYDTTIRSTHVHGWITLPDAIRVSCNVSVIRAMKDVPSRILHDTLAGMGFGERVCSDFPGEAAGILRPVDEWSGLSRYSISIGYEISVTSLQLVAAYAAVANGGVYIEPSLIESIEMNDGHRIQEFYPHSRGRIIPEENSMHLRRMLRSVVTNGTGTKAAVAYYESAGKTGTAQKASLAGGYDEERNTASFAGFAPYDNPRIALVVILDEPKEMTHGGEVAAPYFAKIVSDVLPYLGEGIREVSVAHPEKRERKPIPFDGSRMPDFSGQQASDMTEVVALMQKRYGITVTLTGEGRVISQSVEPGTPLKGITEVVLRMYGGE